MVRTAALLVARGWPPERGARAYNPGGPGPLSRADIARAVVAQLAPGREHDLAVPVARNKPSRFAVASPADISMECADLASLTGLPLEGLAGTVRPALEADGELGR